MEKKKRNTYVDKRRSSLKLLGNVTEYKLGVVRLSNFLSRLPEVEKKIKWYVKYWFAAIKIATTKEVYKRLRARKNLLTCNLMNEIFI